MQEVYKVLIGIGVVILGLPLGILLAKVTKEELKASQVWFKALIIVSLAGAVVSLILSNDAFFFSFLFFAAVTGMSLRPRKAKRARQ